MGFSSSNEKLKLIGLELGSTTILLARFAQMWGLLELKANRLMGLIIVLVPRACVANRYGTTNSLIYVRILEVSRRYLNPKKQWVLFYPLQADGDLTPGSMMF